jgi:hypothetical protein
MEWADADSEGRRNPVYLRLEVLNSAKSVEVRQTAPERVEVYFSALDGSGRVLVAVTPGISSAIGRAVLAMSGLDRLLSPLNRA